MKEQNTKISAAEMKRHDEMHDRIKFESAAGVQEIWMLRLWAL